MYTLLRCLRLIAVASTIGAAVFAGDMNRPALGQTVPVRESLRDCADCPELVAVPPGNMRIDLEDSSNTAIPLRRVSFAGEILFAKHEVTRGQFAVFINEAGYRPSSTVNCTSLSTRYLSWSDGDGDRNWRDPGFDQADTHPVVCVSWNDAKAYVAWLVKKTGKQYRLPSESEWEYAARAGSRRERPWGDEPNIACTYANVWDETYSKNNALPPQAARGIFLRSFKDDIRSDAAFQDLLNRPRTGPWYHVHHWCADGFSFTAPVGSFAANSFGLHDLIGNVMEWVEDCLNLHYRGAPVDGTAWMEGACTHSVVRGGSWASIPEDALSGKRTFRQRDFRASDLGFRVARSP